MLHQSMNPMVNNISWSVDIGSSKMICKKYQCEYVGKPSKIVAGNQLNAASVLDRQAANWNVAMYF